MNNRKNFLNKSGIYSITNTVNNKIYIGRTKCFYKRYYQYKSAFNKKDFTHTNQYLLNSMLKYGFEKFKFDVLEYCEIDMSPERELYWMIKLKSHNKNIGYNLRLDVNGSMIVNESTKKKISNRLKEEWANGKRDSHGKKLKESWKHRDRKAQSETMSKNLTKYKYVITDSAGKKYDICYKALSAFGYQNAVSNFHRNKTDITICKGVLIERVRL